MSIAQTIRELKRAWSTPRRVNEFKGSAPDFALVCRFSDPVTDSAAITEPMPDDLREFWELAASADLFKDDSFGQWGLQILAPDECRRITDDFRAARRVDTLHGDLIIGRFYGDSELLLIRTDRTAGDFGTVMIALPLDQRPEWYSVSQSFSAFLEKYAAQAGDKFWEVA